MDSTHIVVTTDFSEEAERPLAPIGDFARRVGARVTLMHVLQVLPTAHRGRVGTHGAGNPASGRAPAQEALDALIEGFTEGVDVASHVVAATDVADGIVVGAEEIGASLIALSTHGRSGLGRLVLGSVAEGVLRHAHVPVLCFPPPRAGRVAHGLALEHLLVTTDGSDEALRPFRPAFALARELGARVTVLHVAEEEHPIAYGAPPLGPPLAPPSDPPDPVRRKAAARHTIEAQCGSVSAGLHPSIEVLDHAEPAAAIVRFAAEHDVDLIALSTHGRTGFRRLVFGSVAEEVLRKSPVPVLTFPRGRG